MTDRHDYVPIVGSARALRDAAVLFAVGDSVPRAAWIPRSVIHGADDLNLTSQAARIKAAGNRGGIAMTIRMFRWKAEEVGFTGDADSLTADLFEGGPK